MYDEIAALIACDERRGVCNGAEHRVRHRGLLLLFLLLEVVDGVRDVRPCVSDLDAAVSVLQDVPDRSHALRSGLHAQTLKDHRHRVAELHLFVQLRPVEGDGDFRHSDVVRPDVGLSPCGQLCRRGLFLEVLRQIQAQDPAEVEAPLQIDDVRSDDRAFFVCPIRQHSGPDLLAVLLLLEVDEVLSVPDDHAPVLASAGLQRGGVVVVVPLAAVDVDETAFLAAEPRPHRGRHVHLEVRDRADLGADAEGVRDLGIAHQTGTRSTRRGCRKRHHRDAGQVIGDVSGVDRHHAVDFCGNEIDPKSLRAVRGIWLRKDDFTERQFVKMHPVHGVLHNELIFAVSLL